MRVSLRGSTRQLSKAHRNANELSPIKARMGALR